VGECPVPDLGIGAPLNTSRVVKICEPGAFEEAAEIIRRGGLVAFPTETVYGLGSDARNPIAVARIFEAKRRPSFNPLIVHVADAESAKLYGRFADGPASVLIEKFWPGPLTLVVPKTDIVPSIVTAGLDTVAIRMPAHPAALGLIRKAGRAIAAPSANLFGRVSPTEAKHVAAQLSGRVDLILDGGACPVGIESTILDLTGAVPCILRMGGIPPEVLEKLLGRIEWSTLGGGRPKSSGQLARHYATQTPLEIFQVNATHPVVHPGERVGVLTLSSPPCPEQYAAVEVLSASGDLREAAANLFAALHRLDTLKLDRLIALPVPETDLGIAIMDRLRRCAARRDSEPFSC
jgi:L-threonylcarbamoyladenylate synthase